MRLHANDPTGEVFRLRCPAAGDSPTAKCLLKPRSMEPRRIHTTESGEKFDGRPTIVPGKNIDRDHPPRVYAAETISIPTATGAKFQQDVPFGSPEHAHLFNTLRQTQEGYHHGVLRPPDNARTDNPPGAEPPEQTSGVAA